MDLKEERLQWKYDAARLDKLADHMVSVLKNEGTTPVAYMAMDMIYRPFIQWLHSAQIQGIDPFEARNSAIFVINAMVVELTKRMSDVGINGERSSKEDWVRAFILELTGEILIDLGILNEMNAIPRRPS